MGYIKQELLNLGVRCEEIAAARAKIVGLSIFDNIDNIPLDSTVSNNLRFTMEMYNDYLNNLAQFSESNLYKILLSIKNTEVIDNHCLENEPSNELLSYQERHRSTAINYLIRKLVSEGKDLNMAMIVKAHEILMRGTSCEDITQSGLRDENKHFVGYMDNEEKVFQFFPISWDEIKKALTLFSEYYDSPEVQEEDLLVKPFVVHGLLAALQCFEDGNTRLSRVLQHIKLFQISNQMLETILPAPAICFSRTYMPYRQQYRELIAEIAVAPTIENWNKWILFNLRRMQDQLFVNEEALVRARRI